MNSNLNINMNIRIQLRVFVKKNQKIPSGNFKWVLQPLT